jgi:hypothetical protein
LKAVHDPGGAEVDGHRDHHEQLSGRGQSREQRGSPSTLLDAHEVEDTESDQSPDRRGQDDHLRGEVRDDHRDVQDARQRAQRGGQVVVDEDE